MGYIERDMLPLAELALHHDDVIAELTEHCVEAIYILYTLTALPFILAT